MRQPCASGLTMRRAISLDATIKSVDGGYSSAAERLTVAQDVVGSIPTSRPRKPQPRKAAFFIPCLLPLRLAQ